MKTTKDPTILNAIEKIISELNYEECCDIAKYGMNDTQKKLLVNILVDMRIMDLYDSVLKGVKKHCEHEYYGE